MRTRGDSGSARRKRMETLTWRGIRHLGVGSLLRRGGSQQVLAEAVEGGRVGLGVGRRRRTNEARERSCRSRRQPANIPTDGRFAGYIGSRARSPVRGCCAVCTRPGSHAEEECARRPGPSGPGAPGWEEGEPPGTNRVRRAPPPATGSAFFLLSPARSRFTRARSPGPVAQQSPGDPE